MAYKDPTKKRLRDRAYRAADPERWRRYREANKAKRIAQSKAWRARNRAHVLAYGKAYREANKARLQAAYTAWRAANPDKMYTAVHRYHATHEEQVKQGTIRWRKANPDKVAAMHARRRARRKGASVSDLTRAQWDEIKAAYGYRCVYCGRRMQRLTKDHLTPLNDHGNHTKHNVVPACQSCNSKKGIGPVLCPVQPLLL